MSVPISVVVNGKAIETTVDERTLLVTFIREDLKLTGTHIGCDTAQCGACSIHLNGAVVKACSMLALQAQGGMITTIEGIAESDTQLHPMQHAFSENHALQCGFCTPGMVMTALDIIKEYPAPTREIVQEGLDGNLCRCTGYNGIIDAVIAGAKAMNARK
ncbi:carbon-monoxide dehydrogenase small subunit [Beijerinckia sp. GAS462]|nr:carbon-monoxide dehydrogenase small subunit [Beijerinckia sp. GAS462]SED90772.1 carbon-monoxide dehydrogenase small subunit [Beijerinckia sp. 28-YEA-48]